MEHWNIALKLSVYLEWIGQEEVWKKLVCQNPIGHSRLLPILQGHPKQTGFLKSKSLPIYEGDDFNNDPDDVFHSCQKFENLKIESEEVHIELKRIRLKLKDKETQLKSANEFVDTLTNDREDDRLELLKLTQELKEERRSRDYEKALIQELKEQVINYFS